MKSRRVGVALGLAAPVVGLLWWAKAAASWRPVVVARFAVSNNTVPTEPSVSSHQLACTLEETTSSSSRVGALFDTRNGETQTFNLAPSDAIGVQNGLFWRSHSTKEDGPFALEVKDEQGDKKKFSHDSLSLASNDTLRLLPAENRVVLFDPINKIICEWNLKDQKPGEEVELDTTEEASNGGSATLSRDGRKFFLFTGKRFLTGDTSTGTVTATAPLRGIKFYGSVVYSPNGRYALFDQPTKTFRWEVVETATGKHLWGFTIDASASPLWAISGDEQTIIVPNGKAWEARDFQTGALLRRLPCVPDTWLAALSPDGETLYSVAVGVLYRQRAR